MVFRNKVLKRGREIRRLIRSLNRAYEDAEKLEESFPSGKSDLLFSSEVLKLNGYQMTLSIYSSHLEGIVKLAKTDNYFRDLFLNEDLSYIRKYLVGFGWYSNLLSSLNIDHQFDSPSSEAIGSFR